MSELRSLAVKRTALEVWERSIALRNLEELHGVNALPDNSISDELESILHRLIALQAACEAQVNNV